MDEERDERTMALSDPSALTAKMILREVTMLEKQVTQRMDGIEKAVAVAHEDWVRVPTDVEKAVGALNEVVTVKFDVHAQRFATFEEKFASIQTQFKERDTRVAETAQQTKVAVDAALQAAEKAVGKQNEAFSLSIAKSEAATTKQIDQQGTLIANSTAGLNDKIEDLKERLGRVESIAQGRAEQKVTQRDDSKVWMALVSLIVAVIGIAIGFFVRAS